MNLGVCNLTHKHGKLVKAHVIPDSLSKIPEKGKFWIESGTEGRPIRRYTSWFDNNLVTSDGEKILADLDDWAVHHLRKNRLVWSGFDGDEPAFDDEVKIDLAGRGIRLIEGIDGDRLRLFLLSVLWRAGASQREEFHQIKIPQVKLEILRKMILHGRCEPKVVFPVSLTLIPTKGEPQNFAPQKEKRLSALGQGSRKIPIFRFFMDGLIAHFHTQICQKDRLSAGGFAVGASRTLGVVTIPYHLSAQFERIELFKAQAESEWPNEMAKLITANWGPGYP